MKQIAVVVLVAIGGTMLAGVVAFLNEVYLEISFDKLKDFKVTDLESWRRLGTSLKIDLETASPQDYVAYWVDDENGQPLVRKSSISYRNFLQNKRMSGVIADDDDTTPFALTGFYNDNRTVLMHRAKGIGGGVGVYILDRLQFDSLSIVAYVGYGIIEDIVGPDPRNAKLLQCPFVMIGEVTASTKVTSAEAAKTVFPVLNKSCVSFAMPADHMAASAKP
jgi:hypothetical protein